MIQTNSFTHRIALFYPFGNLSAFPGLADAAKLLVERGYCVDIYTKTDANFPSTEMDMRGISIIMDHPEAFLTFTRAYPQLILRLKKGGRPFRWFVMKIYHPLLRQFFFFGYLRKQHARCPYSCAIGMDPEGLVSAALIAEMLNVPLVYWSLELLFTNEIVTNEQRHLKEQEIAASRKVSFTIIQDRWRGQALVNENGLDPARLHYVPNAPRGEARRKKGDLLQRRLGIAPERKVILCAGSIDRWAMSLEVMAAASAWPDEYVLVMQSYARKEFFHSNPYFSEIIETAIPNKIIISFDPVPASEYRDLVDSADIGLAFYHPVPSQNDTTTGRNVYLMGLSSGKLAGYLYSGLPVVVNDATMGPGELVRASHCGICVGEPGQIQAALATIFARYDWYSENAIRCFDKDLELERHFGPVMDRLEKMAWPQ